MTFAEAYATGRRMRSPTRQNTWFDYHAKRQQMCLLAPESAAATDWEVEPVSAQPIKYGAIYKNRVGVRAVLANLDFLDADFITLSGGSRYYGRADTRPMEQLIEQDGWKIEVV